MLQVHGIYWIVVYGIKLMNLVGSHKAGKIPEHRIIVFIHKKSSVCEPLDKHKGSVVILEGTSY